MRFRLKSPAFENGGAIPPLYTGDGKNLSPPLEWEGLPEGTKELALLVEDLDAPAAEPFVHWVVYKIPPDVARLEPGECPSGASQGVNSFARTGYDGPLPPEENGNHRYVFTLFALDAELGLGPGASRESILQAANAHLLAEARLVGKYERSLRRIA